MPADQQSERDTGDESGTCAVVLRRLVGWAARQNGLDRRSDHQLYVWHGFGSGRHNFARRDVDPQRYVFTINFASTISPRSGPPNSVDCTGASPLFSVFSSGLPTLNLDSSDHIRREHALIQHSDFIARR